MDKKRLSKIIFISVGLCCSSKIKPEEFGDKDSWKPGEVFYFKKTGEKKNKKKSGSNKWGEQFCVGVHHE